MSSDATRFGLLGSGFAETGSSSETTWTLCSPLISAILFYLVFFPQKLLRLNMNTHCYFKQELLLICNQTQIDRVLLAPQNNILID